ncbi:MAG: tryptophan synthase subunit alpha [Oscillospiraceae bacterium]|nr:tryptophan synthase subunit alpha [Oscillospiraceae bacterium]
MNRIDKCFAELKAKQRKALITFITAGDPDLDTTVDTALAMYENGADIIELGVPFSDPIAEGITIQRSSLRSLKGGTTLDGIFTAVDRIRAHTDKPLVLMMYLNTIYVYGTEKFFSLCAEKGIDAVIVPDMPYEERDEILPTAERYGVYSINLVSPASHDRIKKIAADSSGFLYCVSSNGVTGVRSEYKTDFDEFFGIIRDNAKCPYCVGFGISGPEQAKTMSAYCDGVIVGSAIVRIMEAEGSASAEKVGAFVKSLRSGLDD